MIGVNSEPIDNEQHHSGEQEEQTKEDKHLASP